MSVATNVNIYNEAGTAIVATGNTADGGANVTIVTGAVAVHSEYQIEVDGGQRRGVMCTAFNAATNVASFE